MSCTCDFCSGRKRWEDNWCARCANVQLKPPKWWENCDICDQCEVEMYWERFDGWRPYEPYKPDLLDEMIASLESTPSVLPDVELTQEMVDALCSE